MLQNCFYGRAKNAGFRTVIIKLSIYPVSSFHSSIYLILKTIYFPSLTSLKLSIHLSTFISIYPSIHLYYPVNRDEREYISFVYAHLYISTLLSIYPQFFRSEATLLISVRSAQGTKYVVHLFSYLPIYLCIYIWVYLKAVQKQKTVQICLSRQCFEKKRIFCGFFDFFYVLRQTRN